MAEAAGLEIGDFSRVVPPLESLEAAFRPLVKTIPHDAEPPLSLRVAFEESPEGSK
jgi:hypothetical protein